MNIPRRRKGGRNGYAVPFTVDVFEMKIYVFWFSYIRVRGLKFEWKTLLDVILCYPRPLYLHALPYYNQIVASVKEPSPWNAEAYFYPPNQRIVRQTSQLRPYSTQLGISTSTSGTHLGLRQGSRVRRRCRQSFIAGQCTVPTPTLPRLRPR